MKQIKQRLKETIEAAELKDREASKGSKAKGESSEAKPSVGKWGTKGGSKKSDMTDIQSNKPAVAKWGVHKTHAEPGVKADNGMSKEDGKKVTRHFLQGLDPNNVAKINVKPAQFSITPVAKMGGKKGTNIFKPVSKSCVTEGIFNGRVELRVGQNKHVFEAVSPESIRRIASSYAAVGQPVDINVFPGIRKSYLNEAFAQSLINAIHYQTMGSTEKVAENTKAAFKKFSSLLESEFNNRAHSNKSDWRRSVVKPAFKQAVTRFNEIYESNLTTYDVTIRAKKGSTVDVYELVSRGINEGHAAAMSMYEVQASAGPTFVIESITIGTKIFKPSDVIKNYAVAPKIMLENIDIDTAFIKGLVSTDGVGINVKKGSGTAKTAGKPETFKPSTAKAKGAETHKPKDTGSVEAALKRDGSGWDKAKKPEQKKPDGRFNVTEGKKKRINERLEAPELKEAEETIYYAGHDNATQQKLKTAYDQFTANRYPAEVTCLMVRILAVSLFYQKLTQSGTDEQEIDRQLEAYDPYNRWRRMNPKLDISDIVGTYKNIGVQLAAMRGSVESPYDLLAQFKPNSIMWARPNEFFGQLKSTVKKKSLTETSPLIIIWRDCAEIINRFDDISEVRQDLCQAFENYREQYYYPFVVAFMLRVYTVDYAMKSDSSVLKRIGMRLIHEWMQKNPSYEYSPDHATKLFQALSRSPVKGKDVHELVQSDRENWPYYNPEHIITALNNVKKDIQ